MCSLYLLLLNFTTCHPKYLALISALKPSSALLLSPNPSSLLGRDLPQLLPCSHHHPCIHKSGDPSCCPLSILSQTSWVVLLLQVCVHSQASHLHHCHCCLGAGGGGCTASSEQPWWAQQCPGSEILPLSLIISSVHLNCELRLPVQEQLVCLQTAARPPPHAATSTPAAAAFVHGCTRP